MTAEVAILNASAIAIAADSAVTIGRGRKIYNSALKVFTLSKHAPVGIMVYGSAGLLDVPWETIIKVYRQELGAKTFATLDNYADQLMAWLPKQVRFFPTSVQERWSNGNISGYFGSIRQEIVTTVDTNIRGGIRVDEEATRGIARRAVDTHFSRLSSLTYLAGMSDRWERAFLRRETTRIDRIMGEVFQQIPVDDVAKKQLRAIAAFVHSREIISDSHSGVVICGFGEDDIYPSVVTNVIDGVFEGKLKFANRPDKTARIKDGNGCSIIPFAQDDMVASFMEGMNPAVDRFTRNYLRQLVERLPELLPDSALAGGQEPAGAVKTALRDDVRALVAKFFEELDQYKRKEHVDPILSMVRVLPKDELASMAEALVNLTAFKRRMTDELETVGGPIDVAVISKGDGFVWVKRKHYFPRELNQNFFATYFRETRNG